MRALLEKDLRLVLIRKSTLFIYLVIGVVFTFSFSGSFTGAYLTMLGTMLALSTISYDDSDNCMAFLLTLPCTRKQYVIEKYLFVYGFSFVAGLVALVIIIFSSFAKGDIVSDMAIIETLASEIPIFVITGGIMIPLQLKYGPEKSRIVLMSIIGIILVLGFMINKIANISGSIENIDNMLNGYSSWMLLFILVVALVMISLLSLSITIKIIDKKEY